MTFLLKFQNGSGAEVCISCRSRQELSHEYFLAKIGVDTAENEPLEVWLKIIQYYSFVSLLRKLADLPEEAPRDGAPEHRRRELRGRADRVHLPRARAGELHRVERHRRRHPQQFHLPMKQPLTNARYH